MRLKKPKSEALSLISQLENAEEEDCESCADLRQGRGKTNGSGNPFG
jgi:hypothetical protein